MARNDERVSIVKAQMLMRRPVSEVVESFVNPAITTRFWFTRSSGRLEPCAVVRWDWEMYGVSTQVRVKKMEQDRRIVIEWDEPPCPIEWQYPSYQ